MGPATSLSPDRTEHVTQACPACGGASLEPIYKVRNIPTTCSVLVETREEALNFPRRDLELAYCADCGFAFNRLFDQSVISYNQSCEESQHFSDTFVQFAKELAGEIATRCQTSGKGVLEIGCGKGEFLLALCSVGNCTGIGIDPGFRSDRIRGQEHANVEFIREFFGPEHYDLPADIVLCRHTLEHIPDVSRFISSVYKLIEKEPGRVAVFETPDAKRVLAEGAFWDVYYEHCSYFTAGSHARLFRRCGFDVTQLDLVYDSQYIFQCAQASSTSTPVSSAVLEDDLVETGLLAARFEHLAETAKASWLETVQKAAQCGENVVLWGGGSKAVSFLTTLELGDEVDCVVDVNPFKQGKFVPGAGHAIVAPESLQDRDPSLVIVLNRIYLDEVRLRLDELGLTPQVVAV